MQWKHIGRGVTAFCMVTGLLYAETICVDGFDSPQMSGEAPACVLMGLVALAVFLLVAGKLIKKWSKANDKDDA